MLEGALVRKELYFHQHLLEGGLPPSISRGIDQSRSALFLLQKQHIGEGQVSIWLEAVRAEVEKRNFITLTALFCYLFCKILPYFLPHNALLYNPHTSTCVKETL